MIHNHVSASLSDFDMEYVVHIPPGGNWKDIPTSIEDKRLKSIREGYASGKGSRSTYYGRLHPDRPSYTISTYFTRPGNGCNLHYDFDGGQHRTISAREAARLQSFPDSHQFSGNSSRAVNIQIGNAVPPVLAYQLANSLGREKSFVDLFCGGGGLSLGFKWAGWKPLVGSDWKEDFTKTYSLNIHDKVVTGDIRDNQTQDAIVEAIGNTRDFFLVGGPPCQGFSTAGLKRTMADERNLLFWAYKDMLEKLNPSGFVFENVSGILNLEKGAVFEMIKNELSSVGYEVEHWVLQSENYGVPQKRKRVFIIGVQKGTNFPNKPIQLTNEQHVTTQNAISDLPPLVAGQDGSKFDYSKEPTTTYQSFMRGVTSVEEYLKTLDKRMPI